MDGTIIDTAEIDEIIERHVFWSRRQRDHESMLVYLQEIERLAATCNFGSRLDEYLRDKFASGLLDFNTRKRIFASEVKTKYDVVKLAQDLEKEEMIEGEDRKDIKISAPSLLPITRGLGSSEDHTFKEESLDINDNKLRILYQNVEGIKTKFYKTFKDNLKSVNDVQFVAVTETFLDNSRSESDFSGGVWDIFKRDRIIDPKNPPKKGARGGVLLAVKPYFKAERRPDLETPTGEDLWISFSLNNRSVYICVVYFKSAADYSDYEPFLVKINDEISKLEGTIVIVGDANLNSAKTVKYRSIFVEVMKDHGFVNINDVRNEIVTMVDVVYVKGGGDSKVCRTSGIVRKVSHHPPLRIEVCVPRDEDVMAI